MTIRTHHSKSNEHLVRPATASARSRSSLSRPNRSRPKSADPRATIREGVPFHKKTPLQRAIDGDVGPPMLGISGMAISTLERIYREEFEGVLANACDHPYVSTTAWNQGSIPHNLVTGSALSPHFFSSTGPGGRSSWASEYTVSFYKRSRSDQLRANDPLKAVGIRAEQMRFFCPIFQALDLYRIGEFRRFGVFA